MAETKFDKSDLTEEQKKAYLESGSSKCPKCKSEDIEGGPVEVDAGGAWQGVRCLECEATWNDIYTLTDVEET